MAGLQPTERPVETILAGVRIIVKAQYDPVRSKLQGQGAKYGRAGRSLLITVLIEPLFV